LGPTEAVGSDIFSRLSFDIDHKLIKKFVPDGRRDIDSQNIHSPSINDSTSTDTSQIVKNNNADYIGKYSVHDIIAHRGTPSKRSKMKFKIIWTGYPIEQASWVGWAKVRNLKVLENYINGVSGLSNLLNISPDKLSILISIIFTNSTLYFLR